MGLGFASFSRTITLTEGKADRRKQSEKRHGTAEDPKKENLLRAQSPQAVGSRSPRREPHPKTPAQTQSNAPRNEKCRSEGRQFFYSIEFLSKSCYRAKLKHKLDYRRLDSESTAKNGQNYYPLWLHPIRKSIPRMDCPPNSGRQYRPPRGSS